MQSRDKSTDSYIFKTTEETTMNKNTFETVKLAKGEMNIYDFGKIKLYAYKTNDFIDEGKITIGGIDFIIKKTNEAYDIEIPEINTVYA